MVQPKKTPTLNCPPRIRKVNINSDISEAKLGIELANNYLINLYDWQCDVVECWLALDEKYRKYIHKTCGLIVGRQNGKSKGIIAARMLIGAVFYGEVIMYTAHRVDTMMQMWDIFVELFGDTRQPLWKTKYPELRGLVDKMSHLNGHYYIKLKNGGELHFGARSTGAVRGTTIDVMIFDEAQYVVPKQQEGALPAMAAAKKKNPQVIYVGTPPDYIENFGEVFETVRESALKDAPGYCWHEWSVAEVGDVSDRSRWYAANPAMGFSLMEDWLETEFYQMSPEGFARERLAYWAPLSSSKAINDEHWENTKGACPAGELDKFCVGVKFAPQERQISMSAASLLKDGSTFCELVMNEENTNNKTNFINWIMDRRDKIALVAIDGKSGADELRERLIKSGLKSGAVKVLGTREVVAAATMLNSSLEENTITHNPDGVLDQSAIESTKRKIGQDGYGFGDNSIPLESLSFANWAAKTTNRHTKIKGARPVRMNR